MTLVELNMLLEEIYELPFLVKIERIYEEDKIYKKSDFYKKYKIPFITLYEKFEMYQRSNRDLKEELQTWINEIIEKLVSTVKDADTGVLVNKIEEFIDAADGSETIVGLIKDLLESFDIERIQKLADEFQEEVKDLK